MHRLAPILIFGFFWGFGGCREKPWPEGPPQSQDEQLAESVWVSRCAECHGRTGRGDGPGAAALKQKPPDFSDPEWQRVEDDDQELEAVILLGGPPLGYSPEMPANPDLAKTPAVGPLLVKKIRSLKRK